jgi:hypothetical protein
MALMCICSHSAEVPLKDHLNTHLLKWRKPIPLSQAANGQMYIQAVEIQFATISLMKNEKE